MTTDDSADPEPPRSSRAAASSRVFYRFSRIFAIRVGGFFPERRARAASPRALRAHGSRLRVGRPPHSSDRETTRGRRGGALLRSRVEPRARRAPTRLPGGALAQLPPLGGRENLRGRARVRGHARGVRGLARARPRDRPPGARRRAVRQAPGDFGGRATGARRRRRVGKEKRKETKAFQLRAPRTGAPSADAPARGGFRARAGASRRRGDGLPPLRGRSVASVRRCHGLGSAPLGRSPRGRRPRGTPRRVRLLTRARAQKTAAAETQRLFSGLRFRRLRLRLRLLSTFEHRGRRYRARFEARTTTRSRSRRRHRVLRQPGVRRRVARRRDRVRGHVTADAAAKNKAPALRLRRARAGGAASADAAEERVRGASRCARGGVGCRRDDAARARGRRRRRDRRAGRAPSEAGPRGKVYLR
jgi:hypothetical protein